MVKAARVLHVLLLGVWLGASALFMAAAPEILEVLDSRHLAGEVITRMLQIIEGYGALAGPVLFVTLFIGWLPQAVPLRNRALGILVMTGAVLLSRYWVTPGIIELKLAMNRRLEHMDPASTLIQEYQSLHTISSALMLLHVAVGLLLLVAAVESRPKRSFGIEL